MTYRNPNPLPDKEHKMTEQEERNERRILEKHQLDNLLIEGRPFFYHLPFAPKHTDAEYEELAKKHDRLLADWWKLTSKYDELKAKLDAMDGLLKAASETAIANGVRYEKAEAELERTKRQLRFAQLKMELKE